MLAPLLALLLPVCAAPTAGEQPPGNLSASYASLFLEGNSALEARRLPDAQRALEAALALRPENANCAYALACVACRRGDLAEASRWIAAAAGWGYADAAVAAWDPDLEGLRKTEKWKELIGGIEERARARPAKTSDLEFDWRPQSVYASLSPDKKRLLLGRGGYGYLYGLPEHELIAVLSRHGERTDDATFSPDGRFILRSTSEDKHEVWDATTGVLLRTLEGTSGWQSRLLPCGDTGLVVGCGTGPEGKVGVWNSLTGKLLRHLPVSFPSSVAVSPDGRRALIAQDSMHGPTSVSLWDLESGTKLADHGDCGRPGFQVDFSSDGSLCFAMSWERCRVVIYDGRTGAELRTIDDGGKRLRFARFHGHDDRLLVQTEAGTLQWIDPRTGTVERSVEIGVRAWGGMADDPSGRSILLADPHDPWDGGSRIELRDGATGERVWQRESSNLLAFELSGSFSKDGSLITCSDWGKVEVMETSTGRSVLELAHPARRLFVEPIADPQSCIVASAEGALERIELATGKERVSRELPGAPVRMVLADRVGEHILLLREDGHATIVRGAELAPVCELDAVQDLASESGCDAMFSPDGGRVALWSRNRGLRLSNTESGALECRIEAGSAPIESFDWSRDGSLLALATADGAVQVFDSKTCAKLGEPIRRDTPPGDDRFQASVVRFSPDSQALAISISDSFARICERASGKTLLEFSHAEDDWAGGIAIGDAAFSVDGALLATTTASFGSVYGWDAKSGKRLWRIDWGAGNPSPMNVRFDPAGERVCTCGMGGWTPHVLDARSGKTLVDLHDRGIGELAFSGDGERLVASTGDSLQVLRASDGTLLCERVELESGGPFLRSESMYVDGSPTALRQIQVLFAGMSAPLDALATVLLDPKRVRASAAGISVARALVPEPPTLVDARCDPADQHTLARAACPNGLHGFEVEVDGQLLDGERVRAATHLAPDGTSAALDLAPIAGRPGTDQRLRISAVARSGIMSRPSFVTRRIEGK